MRDLGTLALTHSSRTTNPERCSARFLAERFGGPDRLRDLPPYESLPPARPMYSGAVSFYRLALDAAGRLQVEESGRFRRHDKVQHVAFGAAGKLWVGFEHRLERWRRRGGSWALADRFEHPHLAALHTVEPLSAERVAVSCSASDAVLVVDLEEASVRTLPLPAELYGQGYELVPEHDLRRHYVDDEAQRTHVNAAFASADGRRLAVSTLIQGAVGVFDLEDGSYRELLRGFVGCHGARFNDRGEVYFADSPNGRLLFVDGGGEVVRRFEVPTFWLHDVQQIHGDLYAFALNAPNELRIYDVEHGDLLFRQGFFTWPFERCFGLARHWPGWLGNSTQALSFQALP